MFGFTDLNNPQLKVTETRTEENVTYEITFIRDAAGVVQPKLQWAETLDPNAPPLDNDDPLVLTALVPNPGASADVITVNEAVSEFGGRRSSVEDRAFRFAWMRRRDARRVAARFL